MKTNKKTSKKTAKKETTNYSEFSYTGKHFTWSGRVYDGLSKDTNSALIVPVSLTLNGVFSLKGCRLWITQHNAWITGPDYKSGDEYKSFTYFDKKLNDEMNALVEAIIDSNDNLSDYVSDNTDLFDEDNND